MGTHRLEKERKKRDRHRRRAYKRQRGLSLWWYIISNLIQWFLIALICLYGVTWSMTRNDNLLHYMAVTFGLWVICWFAVFFLYRAEQREYEREFREYRRRR